MSSSMSKLPELDQMEWESEMDPERKYLTGYFPEEIWETIIKYFDSIDDFRRFQRAFPSFAGLVDTFLQLGQQKRQKVPCLYSILGRTHLRTPERFSTWMAENNDGNPEINPFPSRTVLLKLHQPAPSIFGFDYNVSSSTIYRCFNPNFLPFLEKWGHHIWHLHLEFGSALDIAELIGNVLHRTKDLRTIQLECPDVWMVSNVSGQWTELPYLDDLTSITLDLGRYDDMNMRMSNSFQTLLFKKYTDSIERLCIKTSTNLEFEMSKLSELDLHNCSEQELEQLNKIPFKLRVLRLHAGVNLIPFFSVAETFWVSLQEFSITRSKDLKNYTGITMFPRKVILPNLETFALMRMFGFEAGENWNFMNNLGKLKEFELGINTAAEKRMKRKKPRPILEGTDNAAQFHGRPVFDLVSELDSLKIHDWKEGKGIVTFKKGMKKRVTKLTVMEN